MATLQLMSLSGTHTTVETEPPKNLKATVDEVCKTFGLTKDELAQILNIQSRKTLYNWINEEAVPRKSVMIRLFDLLLVAKAWRSSGFNIKKVQLRKPVVDGQSVFDLLSQPKIKQELILFAGTRLSLMATPAERLQSPFA